jgi:hypothetical protein
MSPPPHAAAARRRRRIILPLRCRSTPPLSPRSRSLFIFLKFFFSAGPTQGRRYGFACGLGDIRRQVRPRAPRGWGGVAMAVADPSRIGGGCGGSEPTMTTTEAETETDITVARRGGGSRTSIAPSAQCTNDEDDHRRHPSPSPTAYDVGFLSVFP